jgi:20S proteasome alpha/beta subunit
VIGTDWKVGTETATAEIQDKLYWVNDNLPVLIAGTIHRAVELRDTIRNYFDHLKAKKQEVESMTPYQMTDLIKRPVAIFKQKLADEHISLKFGMGYKDFRKAIGQNQIPSPIGNETLQEVSNLQFGCWIILPFFWERQPRIYKIDCLGTVELCENFAAIGTGATVAESVLYQRKHEASDPLGPSVYHVFEAMKLGAIASDVGQEHTIDVLYPPGERKKDLTGDCLTDGAKKFLERKFRQFGPKAFERLALPKKAFEQDF